LTSTLAAAQTTWYVDVNGTPPGTGTQTDPYTSIQYAISRPTTLNGDTVRVLPGTYFENVDFLGKAITVASSAGSASTVIDANNVGSVVTFASGEGASSMLTGFTLQHGKGTGVVPSISGGGVYCNGASPTLLQLDVHDNRAFLGGGMYFGSSTAHVVQCSIHDNSLDDNQSGSGIGVYVVCSATPTFDACSISHNRLGVSSGGGGVAGGGSYHNCLISQNLGFGGGVFSPCGNSTFTGCTIRDNTSGSHEGTGSPGGGVFGPATLTNCTITGNYGRFNGGGVFNCTLIGCELANNTVDTEIGSGQSARGAGASASTLIDCNVHDNATFTPPNAVASMGGGIAGGTAARCRIWRNHADDGAGVHGTTLESCTVYGNTAAISGGGFTGDNGSAATIHNSILWGDSPNEIETTHPLPGVSYSDVMGGFAGTGNIALDPLVWAPLTGDFHLKAGSPCIDSGDPSQMDPDSSRIDMGAFPFDPNYCGPSGTYCSAKVNSHGCSPSIASSGTPSLSGADNFFVNATQELNQRSGIMIWSLTPASQLTLGGILCVSTFKRTPAQNSGGSALPTIDCSGTYSYFFSQAYMTAHSITVGTTVYAQYYGRDPFIPDGTGASLSNAIEFTVCP
jgi:hypothetical protein